MLISTGLSMRELIHEFKYQTLVLFKCLLLQPKVDSHSTTWKHYLNSTDAVLRLKL